LAKAMAALQPGDTLIVTKIDRLARSTLDLLRTLDDVTKKRCAGFKSLGDPLVDTGSAHGELMLGILAVLAAFERRLIIERTSEGRAIAKAKGKHMGRPSKLTPFQRDQALARLATGTETLSDIGRSYGVSHTTISRLQA
jgi:DNA invertase Pin-like site-specific DNA recombinase